MMNLSVVDNIRGWYLVSIVLACLTSDAADTFTAGFEPAEGYPTSGSIVGYPTGSNQWSTWTGGQPQIANWNARNGAYSARLYGTSTGHIAWSGDAKYKNVRVEGFALLNFSPSGTGRADLGLISDDDGLAWQIAVALHEDGNLYYRDADGIQLAADSFTVSGNVYYHVAIEADFRTRLARIYAKQAYPGLPSTLTESDLLTFQGESEISFTTECPYADLLGMDTISGAEGFFDTISVTPNTGATGTFSMPASVIIEPVIGLGGGGKYYTSGIPFEQGSGATALRFHYTWEEVEETQGVLQLPSSAYSYMNALEASGMELLHILAYDNELYNTIPRSQLPNFGWYQDQGAAFVAGFANYCGWMAETFGSLGTDQMHYWEIWNEQNSGPADQYVALLDAAVTSILVEDPDAFIVMGAVSRTPIDYIEECLQEGAADLVDAIAFHPYREGHAPEDTFNPGNYGYDPEEVICYADEVEQIRRLVDEYSPVGKHIELWITEMGYWTTDADPQYPKSLAVSHDILAKYLLRSYLQNFALGVSRVYWYNIVESFGITYGSQQPRPAYFAMGNLAEVFPQRQEVRVMSWPVSTSPEIPDLHAYAFQIDAQTVLLFLWQGGEAGDETPARPNYWDKFDVTIPATLTQTQSIEGYDLFSNIHFTVSASTSGGQSVIEDVPVWDSPIMIELTASGLPGTFSAWQQENFVESQLADSTLEESLWGAQAELAGDGVTNRMRQHFGLTPYQAVTSDVLPSVSLAEDGKRVEMHYRRDNKTPPGDGIIEWSEDLSEWNTDGVSTSVMPLNSTSEQVKADIKFGDRNRVFLRLTLPEE